MCALHKLDNDVYSSRLDNYSNATHFLPGASLNPFHCVRCLIATNSPVGQPLNWATFTTPRLSLSGRPISLVAEKLVNHKHQPGIDIYSLRLLMLERT